MRAFWLAVVTAAVAVMTFAGGASAQSPNVATLKVMSEGDLYPRGHYRFVVHSEKVGRDFAVTVTMPAAYAQYGQPATKAAAIYALDNGYDVAGPIAQMLSRTGVMAPAYVVSIGYIEGQPKMRATDYRWQDFGDGSGGPAFLEFLMSELRPFLEARYPLDPARAVLFGHSYGGVFTVNTLAERPKAFSGYIIGSASQISDTLVANLRKAARQADGVRVFIAVGGSEGQSMVDFANRVEAALSVKGSVVKVTNHVYVGETHTAYYPQMAAAAFEWVLPPLPPRAPGRALSAAQYALIVGDYRTDDGRIINISNASSKTMIGVIGVPGYTELVPETPRSFFVKGLDLPVVTFEGPAGEPAAAMVVLLDGKPTRAVRVK